MDLPRIYAGLVLELRTGRICTRPMFLPTLLYQATQQQNELLQVLYMDHLMQHLETVEAAIRCSRGTRHLRQLPVPSTSRT
jgi:hypothetical protein